MPANLHISALYIYPVKSLGGITLTEVNVLKKGFESDRRWMLVDEHGVFLTQRVHASMALFKVKSKGLVFSIGFNGEEVVLPGEPIGETLDAGIWDDRVTVIEADPAISSWFTEKLGLKCRLVMFPENNRRDVDPRYAIGDDQVSLADAYPILLISQASLDDLNNRLSEPVPMNRFRPNIVVAGGDAFQEDEWKRFTIGDMELAGVKKCARCVLTTVDQETAVRSAEPLRTLSRYRKFDNKVLFGQNVIPLTTGKLKVGDTISVL